MSCSFCRQASVDSFVTEAGNNAEISVEVKLCVGHLLEYEKDEYGFLDKHAEKIDELAYDSLIWEAP